MISRQELALWALAARPKTLTAALVPVVVASAAAYRLEMSFLFKPFFFALLSTLFIQIGTNFVNDAADAEKGADTAERLGPTRVVSAGLISARRVWFAAALCFIAAFLLGLPLVYEGGTFILAIGLSGLLFGYLYTSGPWPLAYVGLGDLFVLLYFGILAVAGVYYLHAGGLSWMAVHAGLQVGCLATVLIAVNNLRDHAQDRVAGKRTLAARFGAKFARVEIATLVALPFLGSFCWALEGYWWSAILPFLLVPLGIRLVQDIWRHEPGRIFNSFLGRSAALHLLFGIALSIGLLLDRDLGT